IVRPTLVAEVSAAGDQRRPVRHPPALQPRPRRTGAQSRFAHGAGHAKVLPSKRDQRWTKHRPIRGSIDVVRNIEDARKINTREYPVVSGTRSGTAGTRSQWVSSPVSIGRAETPPA